MASVQSSSDNEPKPIYLLGDEITEIEIEYR